ncbi:MAG TPA: hypothetical protein V6C86_11045 [Oculatellaceae cyanobacterium]
MSDQPITNSGHDALKTPPDKLGKSSAVKTDSTWQEELNRLRTASAAKPAPASTEREGLAQSSAAPTAKVTITQTAAPVAKKEEVAKTPAPTTPAKTESTWNSVVNWVKAAPADISNSVHQYLEANKVTINTNFHNNTLSATDFTGVGNIKAVYDAVVHRNEIVQTIKDHPGWTAAGTVALVAGIKVAPEIEKLGVKGLGAAEEGGITHAILGADAANLAKLAKSGEVAESIASFNGTLNEARVAATELRVGKTELDLTHTAVTGSEGLLSAQPLKLSMGVPSPRISRIPTSLTSGTSDLVKPRLLTFTPTQGAHDLAAFKPLGEASGLHPQAKILSTADTAPRIIAESAPGLVAVKDETAGVLHVQPKMPLQRTELPDARPQLAHVQLDGSHVQTEAPHLSTEVPHGKVLPAAGQHTLADGVKGLNLKVDEGAPHSAVHATAHTGDIPASNLTGRANEAPLKLERPQTPVAKPELTTGEPPVHHQVVEPVPVHVSPETTPGKLVAGQETPEALTKATVPGKTSVEVIPRADQPGLVAQDRLTHRPGQINPEPGAQTAVRQGTHESVVTSQAEAPITHPNGEVTPPVTTVATGDIHPTRFSQVSSEVPVNATVVAKDLHIVQAEAQTTAASTVKELTALKASVTLTPKAADAVRVLETNLSRLSADGAEMMSVSARRQAMEEVESSMKTLKAESSAASSKTALEGLETNVAKLRTANDAIVTHISETTVATASQDLKVVVSKIPNADRATTEAINHSLEQIGTTGVSSEARRAAVEDLSHNVEKLKTTTDAKTFESLEAKVAEISTASRGADSVHFQQALEGSATEFNTAVKAARVSATESGPITQVFERLEMNSAKLANPAAATAAERKVALDQMEADLKVLKSASVSSTEVAEMEHSLQAMRASESGLNAANTELKLSEATPKFTQEVDQVLARPGLTGEQQAELQVLKNTAAAVNSPTFHALSAERQTALLTKVDSQLVKVESQLGEDAAAGLRKSFGEVKSAQAEAAEYKALETADKKLLVSANESGVSLAEHTVRPQSALHETPAGQEMPRTQETGVPERPAVQERPGVQETPGGVKQSNVAHAASEETPAGKPLAQEHAGLPEGERVPQGKPTEGVLDAASGDRIHMTEARPLAEEPAVGEGLHGVRNKIVAESGVVGDAALVENGAKKVGAEVDAATTKMVEPQLSVAQRAGLLAETSEKVAADTATLSKSIESAYRLNTAGRLGGEVEKSEAALAAMRQEMADAAAAGRAPNFALLKSEAAGLPPEAAAALATRVDGLSTSIAAHNQMLALDGSLKTMSADAQGLAHQLAQLSVPGMSSTIAELYSGAISLAEARDRAAVLRSLSEQLAVLAPSLEAPVVQRLAATIEQLRRSDAAANAALADLVNTQLKRAADLSEAREALRVLNAVVPEGTATSQLVKTANDRLAEVERTQRAAERQLQAEQAVHSVGKGDPLTPVLGLRTPGQTLSDLWDRAMNLAGYRSFAPGAAALVAAGVLPFALTSDAYALGFTNGVQPGKAGSDALAGNSATNSPTVSSQAAFSGKTEPQLSPFVQAAIARNYNPTLASNWEQANQARGFFQQAFAPETVQDSVAPVTYVAPRRFVSAPTSAPDVKPRLVYPGFAQQKLNDLAASRRRGGLLSVFADNTTGARTFGNTMAQGGPSGSTRIPAGLSRMVNREIMNNVDLTNEASNGGATTSTTPSGAQINLASVDSDPSTASPVSIAGSADPQGSPLPNAAPERNESVAV